MRSSLLILFTFFIVGIAKAQPTIMSTSEAIAGDINIYQVAQTSGVATPATGANLTWDYSALIDSGGYNIDTFVSPSSTPYAALFPGTNLAISIGNGGYEYYENTSSDWQALGDISPSSADTVRYPNFKNLFHFSFTYNSTYLDSSQQIASSTQGKDTLEYVVSHQGVGYGTLKIPGQSPYTNVLMVKNLEITRIKFLTFILASDTTTSLLFVSPNLRSYIVQVILNDQNKVTKVKYLTTGVVPPPTSYTFNGTGSWNTAGNWKGGVVPTSPIPSGTTVTISPSAGGSCTLNVPMIFAAGSTLTVTTGAIFNVMETLLSLNNK